MSRAFSHLATTMVATPLPTRLVNARASDMKRSIPRINAMLATGIVPTLDNVAASTIKPLPVTPAAPLEVSSSTARMPSCCAKRQIGVGRLGEKQSRHRQIDAGAVQVERIAGRNDEADDGFITPQNLHLGDHPRQYRLGGGGAEHDQEFLLDVADKAENAEPGQPGDRAQHAKNKDQARRVERRHQLGERGQRADAVFPD